MSARTLATPLIGHDGRFIACSGKNLLSFERNGSVAWAIPLNYACRQDISPVSDERGKIYLIAEGRVLKITPSRISSTESPLEIFFNHNSSTMVLEDIIGLSISISYSSLFITIRNRGLFSFLLRGELLWSAGPMLYRFGYRQGCKANISDCYFNSAPVIDQCEGTLYISNTAGQLYSLYIRSSQFRWIQDFSAIDNSMIITPGNNGHLYVSFPRKALLMSLDVSTGNISWQQNVGPLSREKSLPTVDSNGWISIGSLDGTLYSISPNGDMKKFLQATAPDSVIHVSPVLDCSGFAVYISQTVMEEKSSRTIGDYTYISATKPLSILFTLLAPATGTIYWTGKYPGEVSSLLSESDLHYFTLDERVLLTLLSAGRIGNSLPCYTTRQKIAWTCSQARPKSIRTDTGDDKEIMLFLLFQSVFLVILALVVRFCCIFWRKRKLQDNGLQRFLEKRRSLHSKRKTLNKMISKLELKAKDDNTINEGLEQLGEIVKAKEGVERKLSTSYSLGRDRISSKQGSILPLYSGRTNSHSFHSSRKESVTIFNTFSDTSTSEEQRSNSGDDSDSDISNSSHSCREMELKVISKEVEEAGTSTRVVMTGGDHEEGQSDAMVFTNPMDIEHQIHSNVHSQGEDLLMEPLQDSVAKRRMWLKRRRTLSSTN
ncbi:protein GAMETE EXPRESSED 3 [Typha latifolia]|uniref:protein GAMETE EXPRESSED 3 n=1 Tax=Typha latifolia TaxID=4733 RepID=UPI003C2AE38A